MDITRIAITKNRVTTVALLAILFGGFSAYRSLPQAQDPGFTIRAAQITTRFPGASPERVEQLVTDRIEKAVQQIPELDFVASTSKAGLSIVTVNVKEKYRDLRPIWDDLRRKVDALAPTLPAGIIGPDVNDDFGDTYGILIGLTGEGYSDIELERVAEELRDELLRLEDVSSVQILGARPERIYLEYSSARLAQLGISPTQLKNVLTNRNIITPGGEFSTGAEEIIVEPSGNFESIDDLRRTVVAIPGRKQVMYLEDIVDIRRTYLDPRKSEMLINAQPALGLAISLREGGNIVNLGSAVTSLLDEQIDFYPYGVGFRIIHFEPTMVSDTVDGFVSNVVQSVLIVLAVMLVTLGLRTGFVVASLIPMTMLATLLMMSVFGIGLDQVSLAALIIALGMLVDNAIVMSESILVQMEQGKPAVDAAVNTAKELRVPLLVSSLTTCAAFLPIYLAESTVGEFTAPLFKVVSIALLSSWVLALTMIPMLCVVFLKSRSRGPGYVRRAFGRLTRLIARRDDADPPTAPSSGDEEEFGGVFYRGYRAVLGGAIRHRWITLGTALSVFVLAMFAFRFVPALFFPSMKATQFTVTLELPLGTPFEKTQAMVQEIDAYIESDLTADEEVGKHGVVSWASFIGQSPPRYRLAYTPVPSSPEFAMLIVNTDASEVADDLMEKLDAFTFDRYPDLEARIQGMSSGPPVSNPIAIRVSGTNSEQLFAAVDQIKSHLAGMSGTLNVRDDWGPRIKKLKLDVRAQAALRAGVTNQDVAMSMLTNLSGIETSQFREGDDVIPIILRSDAARWAGSGDVGAINIFAQGTGTYVPASQVVTGDIAWQPSKIIRRDRLRTVTITSQLEPGVGAQSTTAALSPWLREHSKQWGRGLRYAVGGEAEASDQANQSIANAMPIAGFIILLLLVTQFNSVRRTGIILVTIPLALVGVVTGLLVMRSYFGFMTLLGVISLAGIVINNAIVLLDRIKIEIDDHGLAPFDALIEAGQRRLRPIVLTTATTTGGLLPLYISGGEMWEPMAVVIMFGLVVSTVLTLIVVPALYATLYQVRA